MNKDQFWEVIDNVNQTSHGVDRESRLCRVVESLIQYSLEEIADWYLIFWIYCHAAFRADLWAISTALGAHTVYSEHDDGFSSFRYWLISCGKEVYMNAMRNPQSLLSVPLNGEQPVFKQFGFVAYQAYDAKLFHIDPNGSGTLFTAIEKRTLDSAVINDIDAELPRYPVIGPEPLEQIFLGKSSNTGSQEPTDIKSLVNTLNMACGYVYKGDQCMEFVFYNTPKNIAYFLGSHMDADEMVVTDVMDQLILNTIGMFINRCPDQALLSEIKKTLIPIQTGEAKPQSFFCPTMDELDEYYAQQDLAQMNEDEEDME